VTWDEFLADWQQVKGKLQAEWNRLTSDDLAAIEGQRERLIGKIRERYAIGKEEAQRRLDAWIDRL
jgi:uncharacterized protein YjbJ (UPF0337 family)